MTAHMITATQNQAHTSLAEGDMAVGNDFRSALRFEPGNGTIVVALAKDQFGLHGKQCDIQGATFTEKQELHLTLCNFQVGKELKKLVTDPEKGPLLTSLIDRYSEPGHFQVAPAQDRPLLRVEKDVPVSVAGGGSRIEHRESIVQEVRCPEAAQFMAELSAVIGRELEAPFLHVTLYSHGSTTGIAINSRKDLETLKAREVSRDTIETNSFSQIERLRVYNQIVGTADVAMLRLIQATPEVELHLLRHFSAVSEDYKQSLTGAKYLQEYPVKKEITISREMIENALATRGSKFLSGQEQVADPRDLIALVREQALERCLSLDGLPLFDGGFCQKAIFSITFPETVGSDALIAVEPGIEYQQAARGKLHGDDFLIKILPGGIGKPTDKISVIIGIIDGKPSIFSAHPGELAPPFPADGQVESERLAAEQFWHNHALVA